MTRLPILCCVLAASALAAPRERLVVTESPIAGFLKIETPQGAREERLPASPLGAGEFPTGCWASPEGSVYAVGKLYTGKPGPDEGVVWKRAANGKWSIAFRLKDRTFHSIAGRSDAEIVVGAIGGYVSFDGRAWRVHDLRFPMMKVWEAGDRLFLEDYHARSKFELRHGTATPTSAPSRPLDADPYACARGSVRYRVFDRQVGPERRVTLSPKEEREALEELKQVEAISKQRGAAK